MSFQPTVSTYQRGARTMAREYYTSPEILAQDVERIFARHWNCVGRASQLAAAGDYMVRTVAGESLIILRDRAGELRASSTSAASRYADLP
jgi:phenylpropionate dioxygenase-like ring-hydroxylating dioxygenase large terminal subunit